MCDRVLAPPDVFLHRQETRRLPCHRRQGVFPRPVSCSPRELSLKPSLQLFLKAPQGRSHAGGDHPGLRSEYQYHLYHSLKKPGHQRRRYLPDEDVRHPLPHRLRPGQVPHHRQPIVVCRRDHPP